MKKKFTILAALMALSLAMAVAQRNSTTRRTNSDRNIKGQYRTEKKSSNDRIVVRNTVTRTKSTSNKDSYQQSRKPSERRVVKQTTEETRTNRHKPSGSVTGTTTRAGVYRPTHSANRPVRRHYSSSRQYTSPRPVHHHYRHAPHTREYRAIHHPYRRPVQVRISWTPVVYRDYCIIYPELRHWGFHVNYRIHTISAYDAYYHVGEVRTVYGEVREVYYARETDEYFLYFGAYYPYHDFTVVVPGWIARNYSRRPGRFFERQHLAVTGLISMWEKKPEMVIKKGYQLKLY